MKLTLISDIHLGVKNNDETFLENTKQFFIKQVCEVIEKNDSKYLLILGDLFDNRINVNILVKNTAMEIFNHILTKFPDLKIMLLVGNHDIYYKNTLEVSSLNMFKKYDERLRVISRIQSMEFDGCKTLLVPWLVEGSKNKDIFTKFIQKYNKTKEQQFDLCLGHFDVNGFEVVRGVVEKHGIPLSDFEAFGNVFSGHFHIRNKMGNVQYLGCPYEITWNDWGDPKGITVFDTDTRTAEFIENTINPKHIIVKISSIDETKLDDLKGNFIKVVIDKDIESSKKNNILSILEKTTADCVTLDETVPVIDGEEVEIDMDRVSSPLEFVWSYTDEVKIPENIEKDKLKIFINDLYLKVLKEAKE
jgi:DNA repair exonuclease SbcCD nuclease subunit